MTGDGGSAAPHARPVLRFAPSPTGELHLGHALSALLNFDWARRLGGTFLVRIEDIDTVRCRPEFTSAILEMLDWLGLRSEGHVLRQSDRFPIYRSAADRLAAMGLLYPCFATRQEIQATASPGRVDPDGAPIYPGLYRDMPADEFARRRAAGEPFAMRLNMAKALAVVAERMGGAPLTAIVLDEAMQPSVAVLDPSVWGDVVLQRKESPTSYHLAVVVDDAWQGVTHVIRGRDLEAATSVHRLLQVLLGLPAPAYHHHRLLTDDQGRKLSKRDGAASLAVLRSEGVTPAEIRRRVGLDRGPQST